jgi:TfoX/Sxy family transcriptional regulator of competence genes
MATERSFIDHVLDVAGLGDRLTARKMFGEYGFHFEGKFIALACDDRFFLKATPALERRGLDLPMASPYPGAKPYPVADELLDDPETLRTLLIETAAELPPPKPKKRSSKKSLKKRPTGAS